MPLMMQTILDAFVVAEGSVSWLSRACSIVTYMYRFAPLYTIKKFVKVRESVSDILLVSISHIHNYKQVFVYAHSSSLASFATCDDNSLSLTIIVDLS